MLLSYFGRIHALIIELTPTFTTTWHHHEPPYLYRWFVEVAEVRCGLPGLLPQHHHVWVDKPEGIDHYLPLNTLYGVHYYGHSPLRQRFKTLLRIDVHTGKPTAKSGVRVVPPYHHLGSGENAYIIIQLSNVHVM